MKATSRCDAQYRLAMRPYEGAASRVVATTVRERRARRRDLRAFHARVARACDSSSATGRHRSRQHERLRVTSVRIAQASATRDADAEALAWILYG